MTCLYEATYDNFIRAFMQIANYKYQVKGGSTWKGPNEVSLTLKVIANCGDPKLLAKAWTNIQMPKILPHKILIALYL